MEKNIKSKKLRELLALAKALRCAAAQTADHTYVLMFLRAAIDLEDRASTLA